MLCGPLLLILYVIHHVELCLVNIPACYAFGKSSVSGDFWP